jgi:Winged helix-turn helix
MSRRKKDPLRALTAEERQELARIARSQAIPAVEVIRAKILLAVARGDGYQAAARAVGRRSGDAVAHLVARFNVEGLAALTPRHGGGRQPTYDPQARARIVAEAAPTPRPQRDGTATWSLSSLRRRLRAAPDSLPRVLT